MCDKESFFRFVMQRVCDGVIKVKRMWGNIVDGCVWEISITNTDKTDLTDNSLSVLSVLSVFKNKDLTEILSYVIGIIPCFCIHKTGIIP